jgi:oxygen-dependent protoporphyrinogen oxidase
MIIHNSARKSQPVVIIGAGMAGLSAAYNLKQQGIEALVLEASGRVGGRMTSDVLSGHIVDRGAQFISSEYPLIVDLFSRLRIGSGELRTTAPRTAVVRGDTPRVVRFDRPLSMRKLINLSVLLTYWRTMRERLENLPARSPSDLSQWVDFDTETLDSWCSREVDQSIIDYIYEPLLQGRYFQTPDKTSRVIGAVLELLVLREAKMLSLSHGLGSFPEMLAAQLDVSLNTPVEAIEVTDKRVHIETSGRTINAGQVICATPAPVARRLIAQPSSRQQEWILSTQYSSSIVVSCITTADFRLPRRLRRVYGVLIPARERGAVAAISIERNKRKPAKGVVGQAVNLLFSHEAALHLQQGDDDEVVASAMASVNDYLPTLSSQLDTYRVYRWPMAVPLTPLGRAVELQAYRKHCKKHVSPIILAGDYLSMPNGEGAVESGMWAARLAAARAV